jgi:hypothetical protein
LKLFKLMKDGGERSHVWGFFLMEAKRVASVVLLIFKDGSREAYHTHAFNALSWVLWGNLTEHLISGETVQYLPSFKPIYTPRNRFHKVESHGTTIALTFRGPWINRWKEYTEDKEHINLTHGRVRIAT